MYCENVMCCKFQSHTTFLNHRYISSDDKKKSGAKRSNEVIIHRRKPHPHNVGQTISIPCRITDNPLRLSPSEWSAISLSLSLSLSHSLTHTHTHTHNNYVIFFPIGSRLFVCLLLGQRGSSKVGLGSLVMAHQ